MLFIFLSWMLQGALLCGVGWLVYARLFRWPTTPACNVVDIFRSFWIGFGVVVAAAQFYALCFPLKGSFLLLAGACAVPGLWLLLRAFLAPRWATLRAPDWRQVAFWILLALFLVRAAVNVSTLEWSGAYDSDLYHFGAVRWAKEYPTVPGLANLFAPLGISSTYLLYAAVVDHGFWYQRAAWIMPGLFVVVLAAQLLWTLLCAPRAARNVKLVCVLLLAYALLLGGDSFASLYYDRPASIFLLVAVLEFLQLPQTEPASRERLAGLGTMLALAAISVSIKPVGFTSAALLGIASLILLRHRPPRAAWLSVWILPLLLATGLLARNAVLSGWLLYPAPVGHLPVAWAMPEDPIPGNTRAGGAYSVRGGYALFQAWARQPGPGYERASQGGRWHWLPGWWERNRQAVEMKLLGGGALLLALGLLHLRRRPRQVFLLLALGVVTVNLLFWFWTAPDLRFSEGLFWLWFALAGAFGLSGLTSFRRTLAGAALVVLAVLVVTPVNWSLPAKVTGWRIGHAWEANGHKVQLQNGQQPPLIVLVPDGDDRIGDASLPSTPYPNPALCCRVPGELRHGFYIAQPPARR